MSSAYHPQLDGQSERSGLNGYLCPNGVVTHHTIFFTHSTTLCEIVYGKSSPIFNAYIP